MPKTTTAKPVPPTVRVASVQAAFGALLLAVSVLAGADELGSQLARYMVVLKEGTSSGQAESLAGTLEHSNLAHKVGIFTEGAMPGLLVDMDAEHLPQIAGEPLVESVVKVVKPTPGSQALNEGKLFKAPTGWAVPGSYLVSLHGDRLGFEDVRTRKPSWQDPNWKARDDRLIANVEALAKELLDAYGGRLTGMFAPSSAGFGCALNEAQAKRMAEDARVKLIAENTYTFLDPVGLSDPVEELHP